MHTCEISLGKQGYKCLCSLVFNGGNQILVDFIWEEYARGKKIRYNSLSNMAAQREQSNAN
jgi:hypothetical protein